MTSTPGPEVRCVHAPSCPGCPLIGKPYPEQLAQKRGNVEDERAAYPEIAHVPVGAPVPADPRAGYRRRAKLVVDGAAVGLFGSDHRVVDLPGCQVLAPALSVVASRIRALLPTRFALRGVDLRATDAGVLVTFIVADGTPEDRVRTLATTLRESTPTVVGVFVAYRDERSPTVLGREPKLLVGEERVEQVLPGGAGAHYVTAGTFAQAHPGQERFLVGEIARLLGASFSPGARVLDLFSGVGVTALELASRGHDVTAVEGYAPSAALCEAAARRQGLRVRAMVGDATRTVQRLGVEGERFDAIVVNPPRSGLSPGLRAALERARPELLIYVSCEPRSLARDAADLARRGLLPDILTPVDMMPQSRDVETLAVFRRGEPPPLVLIHRDERLVVVDAPSDDVVEDAGAPGNLLRRVQALGATAAVPLWRPSRGTSGVCFFAVEPRFVEGLLAELSQVELEHTALVRGIVRTKGTIRRPLGKRAELRDARTRYARLGVHGGHSLVSARMDTEVEHQLSRHFASLGHPVVGDGRWGHEPTNQYFAQRHLLDRPFLHRARARWRRNGSLVEVAAPLPRDLTVVLDALKG